MAYSLATLKASVAGQLGKTDGATPNAVRDTAINDACREFYGGNFWNFNVRVVPVTWTDQGTYGTSPWPALYTPQYDLGRMYVADSSNSTLQHQFGQVPVEDIPTYAENDGDLRVFAVDYGASQFQSNQDLNSPQTYLSYCQMPADFALDGSQDSTAMPVTPSGFAAIRLLSIANYWLAAERDEQNYDRFYARYQKAVALAQSIDNRMGPDVSLAHSNAGANLGFNSSNWNGL